MPPCGEEAEIILEVAPIGRERVRGRRRARRPACRGKSRDEALRRALIAAAGARSGWSTVISRGSGSTKVASANMAAEARPARTREDQRGNGTGSAQGLVAACLDHHACAAKARRPRKWQARADAGATPACDRRRARARKPHERALAAPTCTARPAEPEPTRAGLERGAIRRAARSARSCSSA